LQNTVVSSIKQCRLTILTVTVLEFVISDFLSNKALLLPDLYKKFEDLVDKTPPDQTVKTFS
jgi:hypothetical protein